MQLLNAKDTCKKLSVGMTLLYRIAKTDPSFPKRRQISARRIGWLDNELDDWINAREIKEDPIEAARRRAAYIEARKQELINER